MGRRYNNDERNAEIIRRRQAGEWPSDIRREMGLSRNIVAGVLNRAGLCDPDTDKVTPMLKHHVAMRGEDAGNAKLSWEAVGHIRDVYRKYARDAGSATALAEHYGVTRNCILNAATGRAWAA